MSGDITGEFNLSDNAQNRLALEVSKQIAPMMEMVDANQHRLVSVIKAVEDIKKQNVSQIATLADQDAKMLKFDYWRCSLFGNGSGNPGFLELARKEDKEKYDKLIAVVSELKQEKYREQGKAEALRELEEQRIAQEDRSDTHRTLLWTRYHYAIGIASILLGSWFWSLVHPLAKVLIDHMVTAIR